MKKPAALLLFIITLLLSACVLPMPSSTPSQDQVGTQVSVILTSMPSSSPEPTATAIIVPTQVVATSLATATTIIPSNTPQPTEAETAAATATTAPSATPEATATTAFSPTPPTGDPRSALGNPTWQDNFANDYNWPTGDNDYTSIKIENNQLTLTALTKLDGWRLSYPKLQDFYLEASMKSSNCSGPDHYGLIVRVPDEKTADAGYLFGITCDGQYSIRKWNGTKMTTLVNWAKNDAILAGANQTNRLGVLAVGSHLSLYVNGTLIASTQDSSYLEGYFGIFVGGNNTTNLSVTINSIAYWENPNL